MLKFVCFTALLACPASAVNILSRGKASESEGTVVDLAALEAQLNTNPKLMENLQETWFAIQFVGLDQGNAAKQPNSPFETNSLCLTGVVPTTSSLDGVPLVFKQCQSLDLLGSNGASQVSPQGSKAKLAEKELGAAADVDLKKSTREAQKFGFTTDGRIHSKKFAGKCLRRSLCGERHMYDLAECDDAGVARFLVSRSIASTSNLKPLGRPLQALAYDHGCEICGPYQITQFCKGEQLSGSGKCVHGQNNVGWTRDQSQYIDLDKRAQRKAASNFWTTASNMINYVQSDSGLGKLDDSVCGSSAGDYPSSESFFYLKKFSNSPH